MPDQLRAVGAPNHNGGDGSGHVVASCRFDRDDVVPWHVAVACEVTDDQSRGVSSYAHPSAPDSDQYEAGEQQEYPRALEEARGHRNGGDGQNEDGPDHPDQDVGAAADDRLTQHSNSLTTLPRQSTVRCVFTG